MASSNFAQVLARLIYIAALWWLVGERLEHVAASGNDLSSSPGCCNLCYVQGIFFNFFFFMCVRRLAEQTYRCRTWTVGVYD